MLDVGDGHSLYVETVGPPDGVPAVFLHGGPGSGCQPMHRELFDPSAHYAVLFDQRGAGRSLPSRARHANTTRHLVADMERIREALGIERWMLVGGSWGATLALAYAQSHPHRVSGMVLRAVFLGTRREVEWAFLKAPARLYPDLLDDFLGLLTPAERLDPLSGYWSRILDADPAISAPAVRAWHDTERILSTVRPAQHRLELNSINDPARPLPASPLMEAHYFQNACFLPEDGLLANVGALADIPAIMVQGRFDLLCPPSTAHALCRAWRKARLTIVEGAGHALSDPGVAEAAKSAVAELAGRGNVRSTFEGSSPRAKI